MSNEFLGSESSPGFAVERRRVLRMIGAGAVGSVVAGPVGSASAEKPVAYLVLHSGTVWTGRAHGRRAEGVAVLGTRVVAVGSTRDVLAWAGKRTRVIDLRGAFAAPGFRDQHTHLLNQADAGAAAEAYRPRWEGHDEEAAFESRRVVGQRHIDILDQGRSPVDDFRHGVPGPTLERPARRGQSSCAQRVRSAPSWARFRPCSSSVISSRR